jgi:hypothetical protein
MLTRDDIRGTKGHVKSMAGNSKGNGMGAILMVALLAFSLGRWSVDEGPSEGATEAVAVAVDGSIGDEYRPQPLYAVGSSSRSSAFVEPKDEEPVESGAIFIRNCSHARALGVAPVRAGEPGYSRKLDRDGDGVGCE